MIRWDASQQELLELAAQRQPDPVLVYGPPGSGKSELAVELALRNLQDGHDSKRVLLLSPSRASSARLRDSLEQKIAGAGAHDQTLSVTEQPSKSFASYAFWLLGEARRLRIPGADPQPRLLSGAEQDRIIGEILTTHRSRAEDPTSPWHELQPAFEAPTGLRRELRDFLDRCREYSINSDQLRHYAEAEAGRSIWTALADLAEAYQRTLAQNYPGAYDAAGLITHACRLLEQPIPGAADSVEPVYFWQRERSRLNRIIVDDLQDAGPSIHRLLRMIGADNHVIAFASPDTSVQGFRGARPDQLANWTAPIRSADSPPPVGSMASADSRSQSVPRIFHLPSSYRLSGQVAELYGQVTARIGVVSAVMRRISQPITETGESHEEVPFQPGGGTASLSAYPVALPHLADPLVLQQVLQAHHKHRVPWSQIAVLVRSSSEMKSIARILETHGIAVARSISETVLHDEPAVEPLLRLLSTASGSGDRLSYQDVVGLFGSAYGGLDAVGLRRLHQELLSLDRNFADETVVLTQPDEFAELSRAELLLLRCVTDKDLAETLGAAEAAHPEHIGWVFRPLDRIRRMAQAAQRAIAQDQLAEEPEQALWHVWDAAGVAERWQRQASGSDVAARQANRNLDAVIAVFQTAERFVGQNSGATVEDFIDYISNLELPMDTIAEAGLQHQAVEVLTPSAAAGRQFHTVIVAGLQDGAWPNLQPRGELLGSSDLIALHEVGPEAVTTDRRGKKAQTLQDEYRLFAAAASRASGHLSLVAVDAEETTASSLFDLASPPEYTDEDDTVQQRAALTRVGRVIEGRALAAELRAALEHRSLPGAEDGTRIESSDYQLAANLLARLAQAGVAEAHPDAWWGYRAMTAEGEPISGPEDRLSVSPSRVDSAINSPLGWFTGAAGGTAPATPQQSLGTFIHDIAERHPAADPDTLVQVLEEQWDDFRTGASWANEHEKNRAKKIIRFLGLYFAEAQGKGRVLIGTELVLHYRCEVPTDGNETRTVDVTGMADRVEWSPGDPATNTPAGFYIIDFKTGRRFPADDEVDQWYPQIDIYQWVAVQGAVSAVLHRLLTTAEAELSPRDLQAKQDLLTVFAASGITWDPPTEAIRFTADGQPVTVELNPEQPQQVAGAALVQLGTTNKSLKVQPAGAEATHRAPEQVRQAAAIMSGSAFSAYHEPTQTSCYAGLLCPLCSTGKQVSER